MGKIFYICSVLLIYNIIYFKRFVHRPKIYSHNKKVMQIYSKTIYPYYFFPSGILHTIYQVFRKINVIKQATKSKIVLQMDDKVSILIEIFEPLNNMADKIASKQNVSIQMQMLRIIAKILKIFKKMFPFFAIKFYKASIELCSLKKHTEKLKKHNTVIHLKSKEDLLQNNKNVSMESEIQGNVLLIHGLNGSSNSTYIKGMANIFLKKNCRVFCFNARGSGIPPTSNVFSHIGLISDIEKTIEYILNNFTGDLTLVGFSMGANWVARILGEYQNIERIRMGISVCCPFDFYKLNYTSLSSLFYLAINYFLAHNYKRYIKRATIDKLSLKNSKYLQDVDMKMLHIYGFKNSEDFYKRSSCIRVLGNVTKPILFLNTSDDPIIPENIIPVDECKSNSQISLIIIKGGHLGFFTNGKETMAEVIAGKYFDIITSQIHDNSLFVKN